MIDGLDYSWARPGGAAIAQAGFKFAVRYVPYIGHGGKGLSQEELQDLHSHGVAVALVMERYEERALEGYDSGKIDGLVSKQNLELFQFPSDRPCYIAVDFNCQPEQYPQLDDYFQGVIDALGLDRTGAYGSYAVVEHLKERFGMKWLWQTYAWSGGQLSPNAILHQYNNGQELNGGAVDYNKAYSEDYGQWLPQEELDLEKIKELEDKIAGLEEEIRSALARLTRLNEVLLIRFDLITLALDDVTKVERVWNILEDAGEL